MALYPRSWVEIDLPALRHNLGLLRLALGDAEVKIALVAKADAYGHGLIRVSQFAIKTGRTGSLSRRLLKASPSVKRESAVRSSSFRRLCPRKLKSP